MEINIEYEPNKIYKPLYTEAWTECVLIGGRGSGKTFEASQYVTIELHRDPTKRAVILRDVAKTIKESIFSEVTQRFENIRSKADGHLDDYFKVNEGEIKHKDNVVLFTKGMRKSRVEQTTDLKGLSDIDIAILEEVEDIRDSSRVDTLVDTLRKENVKIIFILNTPDVGHWIIKRYFDLIPAQTDGFFELLPKKINGVLQIFSTYKDNPHLPSNIVKRYEAYGDPTSHTNNPYHYNSSILGLARAFREGLVFPKWNIISDEEYAQLEYNKAYGMDFGSNDPTTLVEIQKHDNNLYINEIFYKSGLNIDQIFELIKDYQDEIIADSSAKQTIDTLNEKIDPDSGNRVWLTPSRKGEGSVKNGIMKMQSYNIFITASSENVINEFQNYIWKKDKNNQKTDVVEDSFNHAIDSIRYALEAVIVTPQFYSI
jgi:phage terminase large subunit